MPMHNHTVMRSSSLLLLPTALLATSLLPAAPSRGTQAEEAPRLLVYCASQEGSEDETIRSSLETALSARLQALRSSIPVFLPREKDKLRYLTDQGVLDTDQVARVNGLRELQDIIGVTEGVAGLFVQVDKVSSYEDIVLGLLLSGSLFNGKESESFTVDARASRYEAKYAKPAERRTVYDIASALILEEVRKRPQILRAPTRVPTLTPTPSLATEEPPAGTPDIASLVASDDIDGSLRRLAQLTATSPRNATLYVAAGDLYLREDHVDYAVLEYKRAVYVAPKNAEALYKLANAYFLRGQASMALETAQRAVALGKEDARVHRLMAQAHLSLMTFHESDRRAAQAKEEFDKALLDFASAAELDPGNPDIKREYADQLLKSENYEKAASCFAQVTTLLPQDAEAWQSLATSLLGTEDYAGGIKALHQSLQLRSSLPHPFTPTQYTGVLRLTDGHAREIYLQTRSDLNEYADDKLTPEALLRRVQKHTQEAERLALVMERIDPPVGQLKTHLQRSLSYQLINQSMVALVAFVETNDPALQEKASLLLSEFVTEYEASRKSHQSGSDSSSDRG